ncbi:CpaF family protein [Pantoea sp. B9002]|uniref:ATPase, T2SS/T4P/T4SS family n=1 Tax=Pantoea sp. B9002 TaxID=2726979 RepID=UPI0015A2FFB5|nr:ATPase, T2SS/T4P/T4SS family [Pantoea sp. B9002]NWA64056.1 CpaF family protein [Pantoea sp. B9002]
MITLMFGDVPESNITSWQLVEDYMQPIAQYYNDPDVTDIMVNRYDVIYVARNNTTSRVDCSFGSEENLSKLITQFARALDQECYGVLDAKFPDSSRICATTTDVTPSGSTLTLRIAPKKHLSGDDLISKGALTKEMFDYIVERLRQYDNLFISGNVGSGKTSLLRAISHFVSELDRMIIAEDTQELYMNWFPNMIALEAPKRKRDINSTVIDLPFLIKTSLRLNGDRIWVGEIRDYPAADAFITATNTGYVGNAATGHSNGCKDSVRRLADLLIKGSNIDFDMAAKNIISGVNLFIHCERRPEFGRKVTEICISDGEKLITVFKYDTEKKQHVKLI